MYHQWIRTHKLQKLWPTLAHVHEVLETLHPGVTRLVGVACIYREVWSKRLITFASPQPGDGGFLGDVCMEYNTDR